MAELFTIHRFYSTYPKEIEVRRWTWYKHPHQLKLRTEFSQKFSIWNRKTHFWFKWITLYANWLKCLSILIKRGFRYYIIRSRISGKFQKFDRCYPINIELLGALWYWGINPTDSNVYKNCTDRKWMKQKREFRLPYPLSIALFWWRH